MKIVLALLVAVVFVLHQDIWNWKDRTLLFDFLPVGLAYHAGYALVCAITMAVLVKFAWPNNLDEPEESNA